MSGEERERKKPKNQPISKDFSALIVTHLFHTNRSFSKICGSVSGIRNLNNRKPKNIPMSIHHLYVHSFRILFQDASKKNVALFERISAPYYVRSRLHILLKRFSLYQFFLPLIIKDLQSLAEAAAKATAIQLNCSINLSFTVHVFDIFNATSILNSLYQFLLRHFQESIDYVCVWFLLSEHAILLLFVRHSHSVFFSLSLDGNRIERSAYSNDIRSLSFIFIYFMSIQYLNNEISGTPKKQRKNGTSEKNIENSERFRCLHAL